MWLKEGASAWVRRVRAEVRGGQRAHREHVASAQFPSVAARVGARVRTGAAGFARTRRDIGARVAHADHARVEVTLSSELSSQKRLLDAVRTRLAAGQGVYKRRGRHSACGARGPLPCCRAGE